VNADEWDRQWVDASRIYRNRGLDNFRARELAHAYVAQRYGPRPEEPPGVSGVKGFGLRLAGGVLVPSKVKSWFDRWGVLVSVAYLAFLGVLEAVKTACESCGWADGALGFLRNSLPVLFALVGMPIDQSLAPEIGAAVAGGVAIYGLGRKLKSMVGKAKGAPAEAPKG